MGLFDTVLVEHPLPDEGAAKVTWWQTKDFDCPALNNYRISAEGRLFRERVRFEDRSDPDATGLMALRGIMTPIHEGWDDMNFHGILNFYGYDRTGLAPDAPYSPERWYEYNAKFTDGQLVALERGDSR